MVRTRRRSPSPAGELRDLLDYAVEWAQFQGGGTAVERGREVIERYLAMEMKK